MSCRTSPAVRRISSAIPWERSSACFWPPQRPEWVPSLTLFGPIARTVATPRVERLRDRARDRPAGRHDRHRGRRRGGRAVFGDKGRQSLARPPSCGRAICGRTPEGFAQSCEALADGRRRRPSAASALPDVYRDRRGRRRSRRRARPRPLRTRSRALRSRCWSVAAIGRRSSVRAMREAPVGTRPGERDRLIEHA